MKRLKIRNKFFKKIIGIFLILLGILGGFLPIMPGFVFFFMGLSLISLDFSKDFKKILSRYRCHKNLFKLCKEVIVSAFINTKKGIMNCFKCKV